MTDEYICTGWACTDCMILLANGEDPAGHMTEDEISAWHAEIDHRNAGYNLTLGMLAEDHDCLDDFGGMTAAEADQECDCETHSFSWSACDVCGSALGGERHAVSFWKITSN
jgi:hypothetical protein